MKIGVQTILGILLGAFCFLIFEGCFRRWAQPERNPSLELKYDAKTPTRLLEFSTPEYLLRKRSISDSSQKQHRLTQSLASGFSEQDCISMKSTYDVVPGLSWGFLPLDYQKKWDTSGCDQYVSSITDSGSSGSGPKLMSAKDAAQLKMKEVVELPEDQGVDDVRDWCHRTKAMHKVVPLKSWGTLPQKKIVSWKRHRCDAVFTTDRINKKPITNCTAVQNVNDSIMMASLPLIGIMAASSTRKTRAPSTKNVALFNFLLPSVTRTLDCGFRYMFMIGYDVGDALYDSAEGMQSVKSWFTENVQKPLALHGIPIYLASKGITNTLKKPGPVFIAMARELYTAHDTDYYYRVNDDTEFLVNWPSKFVNTLRQLSAPYGVVGPYCDQGNKLILTHDFVHKTHMEIFDMNYYPVELVDWWMDDWISFVYGKSRTFKAHQVPVIHHTGAHGQRYEVDQANGKKLKGLIEAGRQQIRKWILKHYQGSDDSVLKKFDQDEYKNFKHHNIPSL